MWEKVNLNTWKTTPCISGKVATEEDIKNGIAVFSIPTGSSPYEIDLPLCGIQVNEESGERTPCIVIQMEHHDGAVIIGVRYLDGGNGVGTNNDIEIYAEPTEEFCV